LEGEAVAVNELLGSLSLDPLAFVERVFHHVQDQLISDDSSVGNGYQPPDEWLADLFGNQLARLIGKEDLSGERQWPAAALRNGNHARLEELEARDAVLAIALGACECWGQCADCPMCGGVGTPGWVLPDEQFYLAYVHPAVSAVANPGDSEFTGT